MLVQLSPKAFLPKEVRFYADVNCSEPLVPLGLLSSLGEVFKAQRDSQILSPGFSSYFQGGSGPALGSAVFCSAAASRNTRSSEQKRWKVGSRWVKPVGCGATSHAGGVVAATLSAV